MWDKSLRAGGWARSPQITEIDAKLGYFAGIHPSFRVISEFSDEDRQAREGKTQCVRGASTSSGSESTAVYALIGAIARLLGGGSVIPNRVLRWSAAR